MVPRPKIDLNTRGKSQYASDSEEDEDDVFIGSKMLPTSTDIRIFERHPPRQHIKLQSFRVLSFLRSINLPPTMTIMVLVLIDMFAVSLVVPLLFQYYKAAGVHSAGHRELLSSLFSASQIAGGILMGMVTDARWLRRRSLLFMSFGGSALSYALIVQGGLAALICSRILVGLVKQTMTVSTAMLVRCTSSETRALHMGRVSAASTVAWIVGPSAGAMLYRYVDPRAPALLASSLFILNIFLAAAWLPEDDDEPSNNRSPSQSTATSQISCIAKLKSCFTSQALGSAVVAHLLFTWVSKATNYSQLGSFYEDMYGLEPHQRGYISSYQQFLMFVVQSTLVGVVLRWSGGERQIICIFTGLMTPVFLLKIIPSLPLFLSVLCPIMSLGFAMTHLALQSLLTHVAPQYSLFSILAALDVLQNAVTVSVPFYRTLLFRWLAATEASNHDRLMVGEPDPVSWIQSSSVHWLVAGIAMFGLLHAPERRKEQSLKGRKVQ